MAIAVVFFGSAAEAVPVLKELAKADGIKVAGVVTQPDRPVGRKKVMTATAVKSAAQEMGLKILTPREWSEEEVSNFKIQIPSDVDLAVLAAYGEILPHKLLTWPRFGFLNVHPSLLPKYRGATPGMGPIMRGEAISGVTIMEMDEAMDHGPVVAQVEDEVSDDDTRQSLTQRLMERGAGILVEVVKEYVGYRESGIMNHELGEKSGDRIQNLGSEDFINAQGGSSQILKQVQNDMVKIYLPPKEQDHERATYTKELKKEDGFFSWELVRAAMAGESAPLDWFPRKLQVLIEDIYKPELAAVFVERAIRALAPWPRGWTEIKLKIQNSKGKSEGQRLRLLTGRLEEKNSESPDAFRSDDSVEAEYRTPSENGAGRIQNSEGGESRGVKLVLDTVRLEGKATMRWEEVGKGIGV